MIAIHHHTEETYYFLVFLDIDLTPSLLPCSTNNIEASENHLFIEEAKVHPYISETITIES